MVHEEIRTEAIQRSSDKGKFAGEEVRSENGGVMDRRPYRGSTKRGGYWRGEKWIAITWGTKITEGLKAREQLVKQCKGCGAEFKVFKNNFKAARWCSWKCGYAARYTNREDPVMKKAIIWGANLLMGLGKFECLVGSIRYALGTKCRYCQTVLSLGNITIDHMEAYGSRENRQDRLIRLRLDRRENLQIICRDCNQLKGDLHHWQFIALLEFLNRDPKMKSIIIRRLRSSLGFSGKKRRLDAKAKELD